MVPAKDVKEANVDLISKSGYFVAKHVIGVVQMKANISNIIAEKTSVHLPNLRRCRDGKMCMVCGPGFVSVANQGDNLKHNQIYQHVMPVHELCENTAKGQAHQNIAKNVCHVSRRPPDNQAKSSACQDCSKLPYTSRKYQDWPFPFKTACMQLIFERICVQLLVSSAERIFFDSGREPFNYLLEIEISTNSFFPSTST